MLLKNASCSGLGTPKIKPFSAIVFSSATALREYASSTSKPCALSSTIAASSAVNAKIDTQSSVRQAGTTPLVLNKPHVGLCPTKLLKDAGTRPEPAVSVPKLKLAMPNATETAEPALEPPEMYSGLKLFWHAP